MTLHVGPLPAGDERHLKALEGAAHERLKRAKFSAGWDGLWPTLLTETTERIAPDVAAYHRSLAEQGVRLVDASEVAEWLRDTGFATFSLDAIHARFLARFGGGDEG